MFTPLEKVHPVRNEFLTGQAAHSIRKLSFITGLTGVTRAIGELIYPRYCLLCRKRITSSNPKNQICNYCLEAITLNTPPFCQKCGRRIKGKFNAKNICGECRHRHYDFDRAWASCPYEGNLKEMLHSFKYRNKTVLKDYLAKLIIDFAQRYFLPVSHCDCVIPIPLSRCKFREREFNQAELLAQALANHFGLMMLRDKLLRIRETPSQTSLDKDARLTNVQGVFSVKEPAGIKDKIILLVDDVFTTGATTSEAAKTLKRAGANVVFVLTLAS